MKYVLQLITLLFSCTLVVAAQGTFSITSNSVGKVRLGMSIKQAKKAMPNCQFKRSSDGEGLALVSITCRKKRVMSLFADEKDPDAKINWNRRIEFIEVWDKRFKTKDGVHPTMFLRDAEKILGKVREIIITQTESREFVTFRKVRKGIEYRTYGGIYTRPNFSTTKYEPDSRIFSIQLSKPE